MSAEKVELPSLNGVTQTGQGESCRKGLCFALILVRKHERFPALSIAADLLFFLAIPFPIGNCPHFHLRCHTHQSTLTLRLTTI